MSNSLLGAGCFDKNMHCQDWAARNECHKNPYSVLTTCPVSCGVDCSKYFNLAVTAPIRDSVEKGATKAGKHLANNCIVCDEPTKELNLQINSSS